MGVVCLFVYECFINPNVSTAMACMYVFYWTTGNFIGSLNKNYIFLYHFPSFLLINNNRPTTAYFCLSSPVSYNVFLSSNIVVPSRARCFFYRLIRLLATNRNRMVGQYLVAGLFLCRCPVCHSDKAISCLCESTVTPSSRCSLTGLLFDLDFLYSNVCWV